MEGEFGGEDFPQPQLKGEGGTKTTLSSPRFLTDYPIKEKKLTFGEASRCLNTLGKDESGVRYAYLMITATEKKLTDVCVILNFKHVLFLDLSGNFLNLESLQVLSEMPFLIYLKAERNRVESAALNPMYYLQVLLLNRNQITETCDINQPILECLELDDNLIYTAQFDIQRLCCLKELSLKGNHLLDLSGTFPPTLEKLFVGENKIRKINLDFYTLTNLKTLHLRGNSIKKLSGFTENSSNLTYLNLRDNKITKVRQFRKLQCLPNLETLIISGNPVSGDEEEKVKGEEDDEHELYGEDAPSPRDKTRIPLLVLLPNLKRINKEVVTMEEREVAEEKKRKILEEIFEELSSDDETEMPTTTDFTTDYTTENEDDEEDSEEHEDEAHEDEENEDGEIVEDRGKLGIIQEADVEETKPDEADEY